jgi:hypothetical protein
MGKVRMLSLGQKWPGDVANNTYWIAVNPMSSGVQHGDGLIVMGRECTILADLENVAADIRAELDLLLAEARERLRPKSN